MTTEGDGNHRLQRFLEAEGAEVDIQPSPPGCSTTSGSTSTTRGSGSRCAARTSGTVGLKGKDGPTKLTAALGRREGRPRASLASTRRPSASSGYHLPDMDQVATISHQYYDNHLRGGEGHMEVGKLIQTVEHRKAHMVISVKPFGCMPSSGVSDGVQSLITARYPEAIFTAIETTGDGEVNVQSRIQMDLFKARKRAEDEFRSAVARSGLSEAALNEAARRAKALHHPPHVVAGTAANQVLAFSR